MRRFCDAQVDRYLEMNPSVARAIREAGVTVVAFELETHTHTLFAAAQAAIDAAEARLGPRDRPVFVAFTDMGEIVESGAFVFHRGERQPFVALRTRRGVFLGYSAVGEGGVAFFDATGAYTGSMPRDEAVLAALAQLTP